MEEKATEQHNQIMARLEQLEKIIMEKVPCFDVSAIELPSATDCLSSSTPRQPQQRQPQQRQPQRQEQASVNSLSCAIIAEDVASASTMSGMGGRRIQKLSLDFI